MITLYHCLGARSLRPLWMIEELALDCTLHTLPFPPRVFDKSFLEINPLGTVPLFIDGPVRMTESSAICHYLGVRYASAQGQGALMVGPEEPDYAAFLNWMYFSDATLTFPQTLVLRYSQLEPPERRQPQVVDDYRRWFLGRLRAVVRATETGEHLCGGRFTAADITVGYALVLAETLGLHAEFAPPVAAYLARLKARPAFQRAAERQR